MIFLIDPIRPLLSISGELVQRVVAPNSFHEDLRQIARLGRGNPLVLIAWGLYCNRAETMHILHPTEPDKENDDEDRKMNEKCC
jgi:hypothetical protein